MAVAEPVSKLAFRAAVEARDLAAVTDAFAPDAVIRGPNSNSGLVRGREEIGAMYAVLFEVFEDLTFTDELYSGDGTAVVTARTRVDGVELEIADHMRLDDQGRIERLTVFFRPLPALAVAVRAIGVALARRQSPARARIVGLLASPLVGQTRLNERFADRTVRSSLR
jgi:ketosteroid isomerase-like protein